MARKVGGSLPVGYGGSAAAASHFAADLGKMATLSEGARFRVHSLVDNVAWTTAVGNDIDFEAVFVEQLRNLARRADRLVAFSTSGRSANVGYTRTELVESVDELEHELVRECLRKTGMLQGVEISTMGDVPSAGSGLGSSSTVTVGLLNAMYGYSGRRRSRVELAVEEGTGPRHFQRGNRLVFFSSAGGRSPGRKNHRSRRRRLPASLLPPPESQESVRAALSELKELPFGFEEEGTTVILDHPRGTR